MDTEASENRRNLPDVDAVVVGAGFAGLYLAHRLTASGFTLRGFEAGGDVGGTWYWNRYPGARCDIESMQYSYQFSEELQQEWEWPERYASQPQILSYINHVADRFDLRRHFTFETRVAGAVFDDEHHLWEVTTDSGETVRARFVLLGVGVLSTTHTPRFDGIEDYQGTLLHTGRWPHYDVDLAGKRVGIIGTGSSAVQAVPVLAEEVEHLYVFQRTPNYVVPARNRELSVDEVAEIKDDYRGFRARAKERPSAFLFPFNPGSALEVSDEERRQQFDAQWEVGGLPFLGAFGDLLLNKQSNQLVTDYWAERVREIVEDPEVAELLIPRGDIFGGKRLCSGTGYLEAFNRDNVTLVDVRDGGIDHFTPQGLAAAGQTFDLDAVICATGFDALTGSVVAMDITGPDGTTLREAWEDGPDTYLGLGIAGFPNLFNTQGPGSPGVFVTMVTGIEHQSDWIVDCMEHMRASGLTRVEADRDAQTAWVQVVADAAAGSLRSQCDSWYMGSNIDGKHRVFMPYIGGFPAYRTYCADEQERGYPSFRLR